MCLQAAATGGDFDVTDEDLSPEDLEAFHRELAAGKLSRAIERWEPWWLSQEAAELELGPSGTRLVAAVEPEGQAGVPTRATARLRTVWRLRPSPCAEARRTTLAGGAGVRSMGGLPAPPTTPLLPLSALIKGEPSPHLLATLLDLLYAYCLVLRLFNGDYRADLAGATDTVLALSAGLSSAAAPNSTPQLALLGCVERAHRLPATGGSGFGISVLRDVVAVLRRGRPVVLTALMDLSRLLDAGRQEVKAAQDPQVRAVRGRAAKGRCECTRRLRSPARRARRTSRRRHGSCYARRKGSCCSSCRGPTSARWRRMRCWRRRQSRSSRSRRRLAASQRCPSSRQSSPAASDMLEGPLLWPP